jgi:prophage regulatory protein
MLDKLLRIDRVLEATTLGQTRLREMVREGTFPAPVALGTRARAWRESEVNAWIAERKSGVIWQQGVKAAKAAHAKRKGRRKHDSVECGAAPPVQSSAEDEDAAWAKIFRDLGFDDEGKRL